MTIDCPRCGKRVPAGAAFCPSCGSLVQEVTDATMVIPQHNSGAPTDVPDKTIVVPYPGAHDSTAPTVEQPTPTLVDRPVHATVFDASPTEMERVRPAPPVAVKKKSSAPALIAIFALIIVIAAGAGGVVIISRMIGSRTNKVVSTATSVQTTTQAPVGAVATSTTTTTPTQSVAPVTTETSAAATTATVPAGDTVAVTAPVARPPATQRAAVPSRPATTPARSSTETVASEETASTEAPAAPAVQTESAAPSRMSRLRSHLPFGHHAAQPATLRPGILGDYSDLKSNRYVTFAAKDPGARLAQSKVSVTMRALAGGGSAASTFRSAIQSALDDITEDASGPAVRAEGAVYWTDGEKWVEIIFRNGAGKVLARVRQNVTDRSVEDGASSAADAIADFYEEN